MESQNAGTRYEDHVIEQVSAANDIVEIISQYIPLKRAGANFVALCPFHKEKTPSFNVNPHKQIFHCFGCHKGGDVFTFVKEYENIETVKNAVEVGLGCSILPKSTILKELKGHTLELIHLQGFDLKRPLAIVHRNKKVFTKAAKIFLESISKSS